MEKLNIDNDTERLRVRFTSWLTTLLRRARIDYVRHQQRELKTVSIEEVTEEKLAIEDKYALYQSGFEFEEERLAEAFFSLPLRRQEVLTMLFVDQKTPSEIAEILHCTVDYVYKQRSRALNSLRKLLNETENSP